MRLIDADKLQIVIMGQDDGVSEADLNRAPTVNAIVIPDGATNGDMIKALFPNIQIEMYNNEYAIWCVDSRNHHQMELSWWNTPYKREDE